MVGIIIKHGPHVVVVTADTAEEVTMIVFDPDEKGGVILTVDDYSDMSGWSVDGYSSE